MSKSFRTPSPLVRLVGPGIMAALGLAGAPAFLAGQQEHITGLAVSKTCPPTAAPGSMFNCTFTVTNLDPDHGVVNLAVTNEVPFPGTPVAVNCNQSGSPVTTLGAAGSTTAGCSGSVTETAPACGSTNIALVDEIAASGNDAVIQQPPGLPVSGSTTNSVLIPACTPTPTRTPTNTPTRTPTLTPTTPRIVEVPTLSFPMLGLLAVLLAGAAFLMMRRQ